MSFDVERDRTPLPARVRPGGGHPGPLLRRHRRRRRSGAGGLRGGHRPVAGRPASRPTPADGSPPRPGNRAIDRLRREASRHDRHAQAARLHEHHEPPEPVGPVNDDRLRLIFTCCHPALAPGAQVALDPAPARRSADPRDRPGVPGARGHHGPAPGARQAEDQGRRASPIGCPATPSCPTGSRAVLAVVYLIFNEGYAASAGDTLLREDLCAEAIRLARLLAELMPDEPEVLGLLALLLLTHARRAARAGSDGSLVLLPDQDRSLWDRALIEEGQALVRGCLRRNLPGPYQIQAAINAVHSDASTAAETDWRQILAALRPADGPRPDSGRRAQPGRRSWPRSTGRRPPWPSIDGLDLDAPTTCSTPPAPTCSSGSAATPPRPRPTTPPWPSPRTRRSAHSSSNASRPPRRPARTALALL